MDETQVKHVIEAALLAAGRPLPLDTLVSLFATKASELDKETLKSALDSLAEDYRGRGLELKEVASGYRIQIKASMSDWLMALWEERAPRYTRALLETLALICYRQPITRAEIEEVRGVTVSTNIVRTLLERNWIRVVGHRDVPGKPEMFGTTKDFLDYFGLKKLEDLPPLADVKDGLPELYPQTDLIDALQVGNDEDTLPEGVEYGESEQPQPELENGSPVAVADSSMEAPVIPEAESDEVAAAEPCDMPGEANANAEETANDGVVPRRAAPEDSGAEPEGDGPVIDTMETSALACADGPADDDEDDATESSVAAVLMAADGGGDDTDAEAAGPLETTPGDGMAVRVSGEAGIASSDEDDRGAEDVPRSSGTDSVAEDASGGSSSDAVNEDEELIQAQVR